MKRNKYGNKRTVVDGITFHSKKEANRYAALKLLERGRVIVHLTLQPRIKVAIDGVKICTYVGDFMYREVKGMQMVVEDTKGFQTPEFKLKWKLCQVLYPETEWRLT